MLTIVAALSLFCQDSEPMQKVHEMHQEIELLRTLNSLSLSKDQLSKVVKAVGESRKKMDDAAAGAKDDIEALLSALKEIRDSLLKGENPGPEQEQKVGEAQRGVGEAMQAINEAEEALGQSLKEILNEKQWAAVLSMGRPDPARGIREHVGRILDHLAQEGNIDEEQLSQMIHESLQHLTKPLGLDEKAIDEEADRIVAILKEAADDKNLESKRDEYVKKIVEEGKLGEAAKKMAPQQHEPGDQAARRAAHTLLQPRTLAVLKKRLENLK